MDVETDRNMLPVLRERFDTEWLARARFEQLREAIADGTEVPEERWPVSWWHRHSGWLTGRR